MALFACRAAAALLIAVRSGLVTLAGTAETDAGGVEVAAAFVAMAAAEACLSWAIFAAALLVAEVTVGMILSIMIWIANLV